MAYSIIRQIVLKNKIFISNKFPVRKENEKNTLG